MLKPKAGNAKAAGIKRKAEEIVESSDGASGELVKSADGKDWVFAWIDVADTAAMVVEGMPARAAVVPHDKQNKAMQSAHHILQELIDGEVGEEVTFEDDAECELFPEVTAALTATAGEAIGFCVAKCAKLGKWGVGVAYGYKDRQKSAKLALAISIGTDANQLDSLAQTDGEFGAYAVAAGLIEKDSLPEGAKGTGAIQYPVLGLSVSSCSALSEKMSTTAPAIIHDKEFEACFSVATDLLWDLIGKASNHIKFEHDEDGDKFPEMKEAIVNAGGEDNCYAIAICEECSVWAVGIAAGWKNREKAAKIALALALADDKKIFNKCIQKYRDFALLAVCAELITADKVPPKPYKGKDGEEESGAKGGKAGKDKGKGKGKWGKDDGWGGKGDDWGKGKGKGKWGGGGDEWAQFEAMMFAMKGAMKGGKGKW